MTAGLRTAVGFLTRIPMGETEGVLARAVGWFPTVGAMIGLAQGLVLVAAVRFVDPLLAAAMSVAASTLITGAFHLDGVADVADAFGGGWTREQRLAILKDSRLGTYGTATVVMVLLIEVAALTTIVERRAVEVVIAVICAHAVSRAAAVVTMRVARPATIDGMAAAYVAEAGPRALSMALTVAAAILLGFALLVGDGMVAIIVMMAAVVVAVAIASAAMITLANRKIDGITGDVLGSVQQISALAVLVVLAAH
ncbi:MAG: adenosylcobinamide-GDP ribazoletransferase [Acidimicrobiia bacterium]|nr:adenosylcobinamide-GDP ribazoletransferase [Acidimicrobiia bacterium]